MGWTIAQQKVIDTRNKNLLVSAAAGSGKTAVLVERIISMISEGKHPVDIDHLLVVTFTNAAAAEMRSRIGKAIDEKLVKEPDNLHLQKQMSLLQSANITTIHSFCLNVIRNYFHRIDLDPSFKIADESEVTLMKSDVIAAVLERWYEEGREDFHTFIESYSYSKSDAPVEELILQLFQFSMSDPWPKDWFLDKQQNFEINSLEELNSTDWMQELLQYVKVVLGDLKLKNADTLQICGEAEGPSAYIPALISDRNLLEKLSEVNSYEELSSVFSELTFARLSGKREEGVSLLKKEKVKQRRDEIKKGLKDLNNQFFFQDSEEMWKDIQKVRTVIQVLFELTLEFMEEFAKKKEEKNLLDFNDLEHFALQILVEEEDGEKIPTLAAMELSEQFDEIMIDEYQDSNLVQETILKSISRERMGSPNRFMVGDVKQSIYKFRLAMPELFMMKYREYLTQDKMENGEINPYQRINLDKNFRSRKVILESVNTIFEQIMVESIGGIVYDESASLKYGELFEEPLKRKEITSSDNLEYKGASRDVELLLVTEEASEISKDNEMDGRNEIVENLEHSNSEEKPEEAIYTKKEMEARLIARKIKEITDPNTGLVLVDTKTKTHRLATYRDIVILLRSMSNWSEIFVNTLMQEGIPAYADTGTGYFQTVEIMTVLNILRIIDNPKQDIPLAGVLYSPIVGLTTTEMAIIRASNRNVSMYTALCSYVNEENEEELKEKLIRFMEQLETFRIKVNHTPLHELIHEVLEQSGYYYYVSAMPSGNRRKANLDMLIAQAVRFEKGSYKGLFHFIRYIEKLHKYEVDFGEAATSGEQDNTVRIMSIHKSKGLEFPVVFVAGMSKQFNNQDLRKSIVLHNEYGVGPEYIDCKLRTKVPTLLKKFIQRKVQIENLGEELRVLYVAMTRAKEKLIMTGYLKSQEDMKAKDFSFFELMSAKSYLDWVLPAMINRMGEDDIIDENFHLLKKDGMSIRVLAKDDLLKDEMKHQLFLHKDEENLFDLTIEESYNESFREEIKTRVNFIYPYEKEANLKVKMTVSELKKLGQFIDDEQSEHLYHEPHIQNRLSEKEEDNLSHTIITEEDIQSEDDIPSDEQVLPATIPDFISEKETILTGTDRGTLYHKVLELLDLSKVNCKEDIIRELNDIVNSKRLTRIEIEMLNLEYILGFIKSDVAKRMRKAEAEGKLYKEKQFVIGIKASELVTGMDSEELILIQGIIDVFFEEDGQLVLLDYKSDVVKNEALLIKRYSVQLDYYRKALEQMLKKKVKDMLIYSLYLGKEIRIE